MGDDLEDFFSRLDPKYSIYAITLRAAGVTRLSEVLDFPGLLALNIPPFDANHISRQLGRRELELEAGGIAQSWQRC